ncbi:DUF1960-domain-containing protein [Hygrophoropsis aurantiaca]|uniref:DUF1960-domain-containing protein n=1 Tax=Hygrophoropsis aurantiaca TaxID=72124 RepID=A0ACB8AS78_9AGAM|nr:DUF1960-domain-containing protein [Hygrophoropsis aurantiaca]
MTKAITKVVYKPNSQSTDEFIAIVDPVEYKKWKAGGWSIPLSSVVDSFEVFHSGQGSQGILGKPSKQQLENIFETSKDVDVVKIILERGSSQAGEGIHGGGSNYNPTRGSAVVDSRGKGLSGI